MEFKGKLIDFVFGLNNRFIATFEVDLNNLSTDELNGLKSAKNALKIDISEIREQRSRNANAYAWVLMDKIAQKLNITKEEVYREIIRNVGVFEILPIREIAVESFCRRWQSKGLGWVCDNLGACKTLKGYVHIIAYYGTSTYDTKEMSRFIDDIVEEAKGLGIETITIEEKNHLLSLWEG